MRKPPVASSLHYLHRGDAKRAYREQCACALVADDVGLFISLLRDLFPNQSDPAKASYKEVENAIQAVIEEVCISVVVCDSFHQETCRTRHSSTTTRVSSLG